MPMQMPPGAPGAAAQAPMPSMPPGGGTGGAPPGAGPDVKAKMQETMVSRLDSLNPQEMAALQSIPMEAMRVLVGKLLPEMGFVFDMVMENAQEPQGGPPENGPPQGAEPPMPPRDAAPPSPPPSAPPAAAAPPPRPAMPPGPPQPQKSRLRELV